MKFIVVLTKLQPFSTASMMPATKAAQFRLPVRRRTFSIPIRLELARCITILSFKAKYENIYLLSYFI